MSEARQTSTFMRRTPYRVYLMLVEGLAPEKRPSSDQLSQSGRGREEQKNRHYDEQLSTHSMMIAD